MNKFKATVFALCVILLITAAPFGVSAGAVGEYVINLSGSIDGSVPSNTGYKFSVLCTEMDETDENGEVVFKKEASYNSSSANAASFELQSDHVKNGGYIYEFSMTECSNSVVVVDPKVVTVYLLKDEFGESIVKVFDSSKEGEEIIDTFPYSVDFDCKSGTAVTVELTRQELSKVYDGTVTYPVAAEDYKLIGVKQGHDVKLNIGLAVFDSADVRTATKVTLSSFTLSGADAEGYALQTSQLECNAKITARPITVKADDIVMTRGEQTPQLTYTLSETLIKGNEFVGNLTCQTDSSAGEYVINRGTLTLSDNYEITFVEGKLTVSNYQPSTVVDSATSITVSGFFPADSTLSVTELAASDNEYKLLSSNVTGEIVKGYNVVLGSGHDGTLSIKFPLDSKYEGKQVKIYQALSAGGVATYTATVIEGVATIEADDGAAFLIVAESTASKEKTSFWLIILRVFLIILGVIVGLALLVVLFFFGMVFFNKTEELKKIIRFLKKHFRKNKQ